MNIKYSDGTMVPLEKILNYFPKVIKFVYEWNSSNSSPINSETVKNLIQNPIFQNLKYLKLGPLPELFDFVSFSEYAKKNQRTDFELIFKRNISHNYKNQIITFINSIFESEESFFPPLFKFAWNDLPHNIKTLVLRALYRDHQQTNNEKPKSLKSFLITPNFTNYF